MLVKIYIFSDIIKKEMCNLSRNLLKQLIKNFLDYQKLQDT